MQRNLAELQKGAFDLAVIGGGIVGASIARDAARRGLSVALVEKDDFACAASEAMSHLVHGGIRYLAQARFGMVRQSLAERAVWRRIAPLHVRPQPCLMPLAGKGRLGVASMRAAVALFNSLGGREGAPSPQPAFVSARAAVAAEPALAMPGLEGALAWHDCRVDEPERVVLTLLVDAVAHGASVANHMECTGLLRRNGRVAGIVVQDAIGRGRIEVRARGVINAAGPWAAELAGRLATGQKSARLTVSKGIHIVAGPIARDAALNLAGRGEHGFVLPWRGMSLIGTTDDAIEGPRDRMSAQPDDVTRLAERIARLLPSARELLAAPLATFASARALPGDAANTYRAAREEAIVDHAGDGAQGLFSAYGGKWTTARRMAEHVVDRVAAALDMKAGPCDTHTALLPGTPDADVPAFLAAWRGRLAGWPAEEADSWVAAYGTSLPERLGKLPLDAGADRREAARFAFAVEDEMAVTPADIARRLARSHGIARPGVEARAAEWLARRAKVTDAGI
ncbi:MAG: FAD-dependent oxidoreductase [Rhizobiaceae bacterium]